MTAFLYSLCLLSAFSGRAGFVVNRSQHLSLGCCHLGRRWSWVEPAVRAFPSVQWPLLPYWGWSWISSWWSRSPGGSDPSGSAPFKCVSLLSQHWLPCPRGGHCWSKKGLCGLWTHDRAQAVVSWLPSQIRTIPMCCPCKCQQWLPLPCWGTPPWCYRVTSVSHSQTLFPLVVAFAPV